MEKWGGHCPSTLKHGGGQLPPLPPMFSAPVVSTGSRSQTLGVVPPAAEEVLIFKSI